VAAPVPQAKGALDTSSAGTLVVPYPAAGVEPDDIAFMVVLSHQPVSIGVINTPPGFTEIVQGTYRNSGAADQGRAALFWKRCDGTEEGTTVTFTRTGDTGVDTTFGGQIYIVRLCTATGDPWDDAVSKFDGDGSTTITYPAVTVSGAERTLLAFLVQADNSPVAGAPTGYAATLGLETWPTGTDGQAGCFDLQDVAADGSVTSANGEVTGWVSFHVSAKPVVVVAEVPFRRVYTPPFMLGVPGGVRLRRFPLAPPQVELPVSETPTPGGAVASGVGPTATVPAPSEGAVAGGSGPVASTDVPAGGAGAAGTEPSPAVPSGQGGADAQGAAPTGALADVPQGGATAQGAEPGAAAPVQAGAATAGGNSPTPEALAAIGGAGAAGAGPDAVVPAPAGGADAQGAAPAPAASVPQGGAAASGTSADAVVPVSPGGALAGGVAPQESVLAEVAPRATFPAAFLVLGPAGIRKLRLARPSAPVAPTSETPTPGGAVAGGASPTVSVPSPQGGAPAAGAAPTAAAAVPQGGAQAAGTSPPSASTSVPQGGATAQGAEPSASTPAPAGGAAAQGTAPSASTSIGAGGASAAGPAPGASTVVTIGGASATGTTADAVVPLGQGGAQAGGNPPTAPTFETPTPGGAVAGGVGPGSGVPSGSGGGGAGGTSVPGATVLVLAGGAVAGGYEPAAPTVTVVVVGRASSRTVARAAASGRAAVTSAAR